MAAFRRSLLAAFLIHHSKVFAQSSLCNAISDLNVEKWWNASASAKMPALRIDGPNVEASDTEDWELLLHLPGSLFLNTGDSRTADPDFGACYEQLRISTDANNGNDKWFFTREVLERSLDDKGDCKVMLGEECVQELKEQYLRKARTSMEWGLCQGTYAKPPEPEIIPWDWSVPEACRGLVNGQDEWPYLMLGKEGLSSDS